jgi:hypothetical protein
LQTNNFFVSSSTNGQTTNFRLHDEKMVNKLRKIAWASIFLIFHSKQQLIYIYRKQNLQKTATFYLFAADGTWKWQTSICLLQTKIENRSLFFLVTK